MKRSLWNISLAVACACLAFASVAVERVANVAVAAVKLVKATVLHGFELAAGKDDSKSAVVVAFVQAKAFVLRKMKRERPQITNDWRACALPPDRPRLTAGVLSKKAAFVQPFFAKEHPIHV